MRFRSHFMLVFTLLSAMQAAADKPLRIYLPEEKQLESTTVLLGKVGILMGDPVLVAKAQELALGTFSAEGQTLTVDRTTILSRLASAGIRAQQVQILGAQAVQIGRNEVTLSADSIIACAQRYLDGQLAGVKGVTAAVIRPPQQVVLAAAGGAAEMTVTDDAAQSGGVRRVRVAILQNGKAVSHQDVFFTVRYAVRRIVAVAELPAGAALTSENIRVETAQSDQPEPQGWAVPYGMTTKQRIAVNGVLTEAILQAPQPVMVVQKRQAVLVRVDNGLLFVSAMGEALDDGAAGQVIRVRRGQRPDERVIACRVMPDGSVEPVF